MATTAGSNKRRRVESPVQEQTISPFETHDLPHYKDLADRPLMLYEQAPTEAQFQEIVEKLDQSDVRKLLTQAAQYLDQSAVRKLLLNAAVSNELVGLKVASELTHIQLLCKNERAWKIQEERPSPLQPEPLVQQHESPIVQDEEGLVFASEIQQVDDIINKKWVRLSRTQQFEKAGEAANLVKQEITKIAQSVTWRSHFETKMNGILALLDIGTIIIDGTGCIADEVCKRVGHDEWFSNTVMDIVSLMLPSEVQTFAADEIQTLENLDLKRRGHAFSMASRRSSIFSDIRFCRLPELHTISTMTTTVCGSI